MSNEPQSTKPRTLNGLCVGGASAPLSRFAWVALSYRHEVELEVVVKLLTLGTDPLGSLNAQFKYFTRLLCTKLNSPRRRLDTPGSRILRI